MVFAAALLFIFLVCGGVTKFQDTNIRPGELTSSAIDYFLCRICGNDLSPVSTLMHIDCPASLKSRTTHQFGIKDIRIHTVQNSLHLKFDVIILKKAFCIGKGNWQSDFSWFPGYVWKVCVCAHCGQHIGWMFEPLHLATKDKIYPSKEGFYATIVSSIVNEIYADSLIVVPKHFTARSLTSDKLN
ncbi:protein cereblon-like [Daktulosphaira vitifoliae]|uniref:protein cereblon-like n=1 Tax=Daktulosphaira vitifoliae TaxID=58002 RepID=UPI0021AA408A|nr:protein cereblon-like [Daktulosphaira vitifoliae]XP_050542240.1 protein cereblon-like [Daktulosphaira vitifoliae]XP_050542241.1 protein cereblon-like [Daktulosphaira vitifoliae]XP_050542243.1 protein cereblon-like [Daktulosphaira vitifoliae]XP_050542244.1 protein cereblon-like [Daktulosphaira vitifoliae]